MAAIEYVDTTIATGLDDGTSWANAWRNAVTALGSALTSCSAGGTIYIKCDSVHQYSADTTLVSTNGVSGNPVTIVSVLETTTNEPPVSGDFKTMIDGSGSLDAKTNGAYDMNITGYDIWIGVYFISGDDTKFGGNERSTILINCDIEVADNTHFGYSAEEGVTWENCNFVQETPGSMTFNCNFHWCGGAYSFGSTGAVTSVLFAISSDAQGILSIEDVEFTGPDAGDYMVKDSYALFTVLLKRCKIPAACNYMNVGPTGPACLVKFHSVDDGNNIHTFKEYYFEGQIESDTAVVRSATYDGTNKYSAKMVAGKGNTVTWSRPLRFKLAEIYCSANPTLEMHFNLDSASVIQNDELWFEIEYPDTTVGALGKIDRSSRPSTILTTSANQGSSGGDPGGWTESFANPQARSKSVTISGGQAGIHTIWACLAKEATVYVCPKVVVT